MSGRLLIIGSDGLLGSSLYEHWYARELPVVKTRRTPDSTDDPAMLLDLATPISSWPRFTEIKAAVLCAAVTSGERCRRDPVTTRHINVHQSVQLAEQLIEQGAFVVFLSTNAVFDGSKPWRDPDEAVCPMTEYGRQKAEAEGKFKQFGDCCAIIRLTKVVHGETPLLRGWLDDLRHQKMIVPFADLVCAPISLEATVRAIATVAERSLAGIWQLSARVDVTYVEIAQRLAHSRKLDDSLIRPAYCRPTADFEHIPQHTTLNVCKSSDTLNFVTPEPLELIDTLFV